MNALFVAVLASLAVLSQAAPSGHGAVIAGPAGIVTGHGAIGPVGHGIGLGWGAGAWNGGWGHGVALAAPAVVAAPVASHAVIAGPVAAGAVVAGPVGHGLVGHGLVGHGLVGNGLVGHGVVLGHGVSHGVAAITAGGGSIAATGHGAAIRGPPTAPVVVAGPAGKISADGLWGPTANIGGHGALGAVGHVGIAHGHDW